MVPVRRRTIDALVRKHTKVTPMLYEPPIREDAAGALRVGRSRVLLELVIHAFQDGATPEEVCQRYPSLSLADTYGAIAYFLAHREEIDEYLSQRERKTVEMDARMKAREGDLSAVRARLEARRREP